jgi:hypothetical protein
MQRSPSDAQRSSAAVCNRRMRREPSASTPAENAQTGHRPGLSRFPHSATPVVCAVSVRRPSAPDPRSGSVSEDVGQAVRHCARAPRRTSDRARVFGARAALALIAQAGRRRGRPRTGRPARRKRGRARPRPVATRERAIPARARSTPASQSVDFPMPASPSSTSAAGPLSASSTKTWRRPSSSSLLTISNTILLANDGDRGREEGNLALAVWWTEPRLRGSGASSLTPVVASVVVGEPPRWAHDVRCPSHRPGARVEPLLLPASCCSFGRHGKDGLDQAVVARAAAEVAAEADTHVVLARCRDPSEERRCGDQHPGCAEA